MRAVFAGLRRWRCVRQRLRAEGDAVPNAFVQVVQKHLRKHLREANAECFGVVAGNKESDHDRVDRPKESPADSLDQTAMMLVLAPNRPIPQVTMPPPEVKPQPDTFVHIV